MNKPFTDKDKQALEKILPIIIPIIQHSIREALVEKIKETRNEHAKKATL